MLDLALPNPNRLVCPGSMFAPGFDPSHVAARGMIPKNSFSAVSIGGTFFDLLTRRAFSPGAFGASALFGVIGPANGFTAGPGATAYTLAGTSSSSPKQTTAGIFVSTNISGKNVISGLGGDGNGMVMLLETNTPGQVAVYASGEDNSGLICKANTPYFAAASTNGNGGTTNFVLVNLLTGAVQSSSVTSGVTCAASSNYVVACDTFDEPTIGGVAAAMWSPTYLTRTQLLEWAQDPWAFWYPRPAFDLLNIPEALAPPLAPTVGGYDLPLPSPTPLVYPGWWSIAGIDSQHPASQPTLRFSAVPNGNSMRNLLNGQFPSSMANGGLKFKPSPQGPSVFDSGSNADFRYAGNPAVSDSRVTIAGIFTATTTTGTNTVFCTSSAASTGYRFGLNGTAFVIQDIATGGGTFGATVVYGVPYFVVGSIWYNGTNYVCNLTVARLDTGQIVLSKTDTNTTGAPAASNGTYVVGNEGGGFVDFAGNIDAVMFSTAFLNLDQQRRWAQDPWSFWYPRPAFDPLSVFGAAGAAAAPVVTGGSTLPFMGVG